MPRSFVGDHAMLGGVGFATLFVHGIAPSSGLEILTGEPLGAGTRDAVVGGPTPVATDFGVAFQALAGEVFGTRLWTLAEGALGAADNPLTVEFTAENSLGTGLAFNGGWIGATERCGTGCFWRRRKSPLARTSRARNRAARALRPG